MMYLAIVVGVFSASVLGSAAGMYLGAQMIVPALEAALKRVTELDRDNLKKWSHEFAEKMKR